MSLEEHHRFILNCMDRQTDIARKLIEELEGRNAALAAENERLRVRVAELLRQVSAVRNITDSERQEIAAAKEGRDAK